MKPILIGPISQLLTMDNLPLGGPIDDSSLEIIPNAGILIQNGTIIDVDSFESLAKPGTKIHEIDIPVVAVPGFIDAHTHICFAGSRAADYALRSSGLSYQDIAARGGGILDTVKKTRDVSQEDLVKLTLERLKKQTLLGVTTCEIKSGYGLSIAEELKLLNAIKVASTQTPVHIIPTCLAAHTKPPEFASSIDYLNSIINELFPLLKTHQLCNRIDIFIEKGAFSVDEGRFFLKKAKEAGFSICVHANQFSSGGAAVAAEFSASSADHLEHITQEECQRLKEADVVAIVLPGASLGLGVPMPPARMMLDEGLIVAIASDCNPGSAPMGNLLVQAAVLGAAEKLTIAETLAGITFRAARALDLSKKGIIKKSYAFDITLFQVDNYQEIFYNQGSLVPWRTYINGIKIK